jgi:hypothetical protein
VGEESGIGRVGRLPCTLGKNKYPSTLVVAFEGRLRYMNRWFPSIIFTAITEPPHFVFVLYILPDSGTRDILEDIFPSSSLFLVIRNLRIGRRGRFGILRWFWGRCLLGSGRHRRGRGSRRDSFRGDTDLVCSLLENDDMTIGPEYSEGAVSLVVKFRIHACVVQFPSDKHLGANIQFLILPDRPVVVLLVGRLGLR